MSFGAAIASVFKRPSVPAAGPPFLAAGGGLSGFAWAWLLALAPAAASGVWRGGLRVLAAIVVSCAASSAVEIAFAAVRGRKLLPGSYLPGLVLALALPPGTPLWMSALGAAFGNFFGKEVFGGTGSNIFNPAVVGKCFLFLSYPTVMMEAVRDAGPASGSGETCAACILLGGAILAATRWGSWRTMLSVVLSAGALGAALWASSPGRFDHPLSVVLSGGILFGAVFMAPDPGTSPASKSCKWIYGAMIGILAVVIKNFSAYNAYSQGMMFAVLLGNLFAPMLDSAAWAIRSRGFAQT